MLPQSQALKVLVADTRQGKHETDRDAKPVHDMGEGSEAQASVTRLLRADGREKPTPDNG